MTTMLLSLAIAAALAAGAAGTVLLRRRSRIRGPATADPDALSLTFDTATARARRGWAAFWARDPFVQAQRERTGTAFATYDVPGGDPIAVHLAANDLQHHALVLGATGSGKSSLLESLAVAHLRAKRPFALIDLHGELFSRVSGWALLERTPGLVLLDFTRPELLPGWNPLVPVPGVDPGRQVDLLVGVLKRLYAGEDAASWAWGVKVEELMRHATRAIIEAHASGGVVYSLADLPQFFLLPEIMQGVVKHASPESRAYFTTRYGAREQMYVSAVLNKLEPFLGSMAVQRFLGQPTSTFDLLAALDRGETLVINLAKGYLGPTADVMGRLLVNVLQMAALRREAVPLDKRRPYALLLDEAHVLAGAESGLEDFLVAARKYKVFVTLAAQGLSLFPASFRPHLLGNTGRQFFFRLPYSEGSALAHDIFEPLGTVWREQTRPNERIDEPLLTATEEIAWRTRELANLPVGACYWYLKDRPYRARRIQVLKPVPMPLSEAKLRKAIDAAMLARKSGTPPPELEKVLDSGLQKAIAERSARRVRAAGINDHIDA
jgi:hypothetical protein